MNILDCDNCQDILLGYLSDLPSKWRQQIASTICKSLGDNTLRCTDVKKCETLTSLSAFSRSGSVISITYKDENGAESTSSFNFTDLLTGSLDDVDPNCITSKNVWAGLTYIQRIQAIIDDHCECCSGQLCPDVTDIVGTSETVFNVILSFVSDTQDSDAGVTATVESTSSFTQLQFISIPGPVGTPINMSITIGGNLFMIVDFPDEYLGQPFTLIDNASVEYNGVFTNGLLEF